MKTNAPKPQRCAIYTRKSTEHNLSPLTRSVDLKVRRQDDNARWVSISRFSVRRPEQPAPWWNLIG
jgi:hypothetical protein